MSHDNEMLYKMWMSKIPMGMGENFEFMDILWIYLWTVG